MKETNLCKFCNTEDPSVLSYGSLYKETGCNRVIIGYITYLDFTGEYPRLVTESDCTKAEQIIHYCPECGRCLDA